MSFFPVTKAHPPPLASYMCNGYLMSSSATSAAGVATRSATRRRPDGRTACMQSRVKNTRRTSRLESVVLVPAIWLGIFVPGKLHHSQPRSECLFRSLVAIENRQEGWIHRQPCGPHIKSNGGPFMTNGALGPPKEDPHPA